MQHFVINEWINGINADLLSKSQPVSNPIHAPNQIDTYDFPIVYNKVIN